MAPHDPHLSTYVYFARKKSCDDRLVKIGYSQTVRSRMSALGCIPILTLRGVHRDARATERYLHDLFSPCRVEGEWFEYTEELSDLMFCLLHEEIRLPRMETMFST